MDDPGQEIIQDYVLVMESNEFLDARKVHSRVISQSAIVEPQEEPLQLRNNAVLVVARVPNQRPPGICVVARQVPCIRRASRNWIAEQKRVVPIVQVGLIVR